jgi:hypothetical protein
MIKELEGSFRGFTIWSVTRESRKVSLDTLVSLLYKTCTKDYQVAVRKTKDTRQLLNNIFGITAYLNPERNKTIVIIIPKDDKVNKGIERVSTIAHECLHAAFVCYSKTGDFRRKYPLSSKKEQFEEGFIQLYERIFKQVLAYDITESIE